jgi:hypothetical protein
MGVKMCKLLTSGDRLYNRYAYTVGINNNIKGIVF